MSVFNSYNAVDCTKASCHIVKDWDYHAFKQKLIRGNEHPLSSTSAMILVLESSNKKYVQSATRYSLYRLDVLGICSIAPTNEESISDDRFRVILERRHSFNL